MEWWAFDHEPSLSKCGPQSAGGPQTNCLGTMGQILSPSPDLLNQACVSPDLQVIHQHI